MLVAKIVVLGMLDALAVLLVGVLLGRGDYAVAAVAVVFVALLNVIYLSERFLPAKYIAPGLVFLAIFQVFVIGYTVYIAFTNYSTGHILTKDQAVEALLSQSQRRVPDSPTYDLTVVDKGANLSFLVTAPDGTALLGDEDDPLEPVEATFSGGKAVAVDGYNSLKFADILGRQDEIFALSVPFTDGAATGSLRTLDGRTAYEYTSNLSYSSSTGILTDTTTGQAFHDGGQGAFAADDGTQILPGWQVNVGLDNFARAVSEPSIRGPLVYVTAWTIAFAVLSVALTFGMGLLMALIFNDPTMRGRTAYRIVMVLPYAFPAFLGAMVWSGMLSQSFGFINQVLLGGASIPWLTDPILAKVAVLLVNLWLGFPYMFLVATGALQAIPGEVREAARMDGTSRWQMLRHIEVPLLLVSLAPILISSFAFNFNNFNVIYLVTGGGPRDTGAGIPVGHTDILISLVYKVAFTGQNRDYGLASAFSIIIFIVVAAISIISFRRTKSLEEIN
ncbi:MAG: ABC transporter permease subunit [Demequinaceae bacterium]|nr:ABC transporter permease subunit [Demequinaceae bacterium]